MTAAETVWVEEMQERLEKLVTRIERIVEKLAARDREGKS